MEHVTIWEVMGRQKKNLARQELTSTKTVQAKGVRV